MRYNEEEKRTLVSLYYNGKTVSEICQKHLLHLDSDTSAC